MGFVVVPRKARPRRGPHTAAHSGGRRRSVLGSGRHAVWGHCCLWVRQHPGVERVEYRQELIRFLGSVGALKDHQQNNVASDKSLLGLNVGRVCVKTNEVEQRHPLY